MNRDELESRLDLVLAWNALAESYSMNREGEKALWARERFLKERAELIEIIMEGQEQ